MFGTTSTMLLTTYLWPQSSKVMSSLCRSIVLRSWRTLTQDQHNWPHAIYIEECLNSIKWSPLWFDVVGPRIDRHLAEEFKRSRLAIRRPGRERVPSVQQSRMHIQSPSVSERRVQKTFRRNAGDSMVSPKLLLQNEQLGSNCQNRHIIRSQLHRFRSRPNEQKIRKLC